LCVGTNNTQTFGIAQVQAIWLFGLLLAMVVKINLYWVLSVWLIAPELKGFTRHAIGYPVELDLWTIYGVLQSVFYPMVSMKVKHINNGL